MKGKRSILVDARIDDDDKIASLPSDAARWAFVVAATKAKWNEPQGRFSSEAHLKAALVGRTEHVGALVKSGLIIRQQDGSYVFPGWANWNTAISSAERTAAWRARRAQEEQDAAEKALTPLPAVKPALRPMGDRVAHRG